MTRTTVSLSKDTHRYLETVAREESQEIGRRVSLSTVIARICDIAVDEMRKREGANQ